MLINGSQTGRIDVSDRGLLYGDGLFETIAVVDGRPRLWERHMERLEEGQRRLGFPLQDPGLIEREARSLLGEGGRGVLKILLTRGVGGRGYRPPTQPRVTRILSLHAWPHQPLEWFRSGLRLRLCETPLAGNPRLAGIKHLNRLEQVLARREWSDPAVAEGLMLDLQGRVIEATQANLFVLSAGHLITPDLTACGVAGVVRGLVLELARALGLALQIRSLGQEQVLQADALFLSNSLLGACPVASLEGRTYDPDRLPLELLERVNREALGDWAVARGLARQ